MKYNQLDMCLAYLLKKAGFETCEIEVLISLINSGCDIDDIFEKGIFENKREIKIGLKKLLDKGIVLKENNIYKIESIDIVKKYFSILDNSKSVKNKILKRLNSLFQASYENSVSGLNINPYFRFINKRFNNNYNNIFSIFKKTMPKVDIKVLSNCNINCIYCCDEEKMKRYSSIREIEKNIQLASTTNIKNLIISGGEITTRKDGPEIISIAKKYGFQSIEIFTNGLMFYSKNLIDEYIKKGVDSIIIHTSAVNGKIYEEIVQRGSTFKVLINALNNLSQIKNINLTIVSVINTLNIDHIISLSSYFKEFIKKSNFNRFFHFISFYCAHSSDSNASKNRKLLLPKLSYSSEKIKKAIDLVNEKGIFNLMYTGIPFCLMKGYEIYNLDLYFLPITFIVDENTGLVKSDYSFLEKVYVKREECNKCIHNIYCKGVVKIYAIEYGLGELKPVM